IRDWSVTGVQTCALPISARTAYESGMTVQPGNTNNGEISRADLLPFLVSSSELRRRSFLWPGVTLAVFSAALLIFAAAESEKGRSEERRVGESGRTGGRW